MRSLSRHDTHSPDAAPPALNVREHALFLDLDGTLAPIVARPELVHLSGELQQLLQHLAHAMNGAFALVTGRTIADADRILGGKLENVAGEHGYEVRRAADVFHGDVDLQSVAAARDEARALLRGSAAGSHIEAKAASVAFHFRQAPQAANEVRHVAEAMATKHGLQLLEGKMVIELLAGEHDKGRALEAFLSEAPFAGRIPIAVGDDVTDEHAFIAAAARGGYGVLVGEPRETAAAYRLADPAAVAAWLAAAMAPVS